MFPANLRAKRPSQFTVLNEDQIKTEQKMRNEKKEIEERFKRLE